MKDAGLNLQQADEATKLRHCLWAICRRLTWIAVLLGVEIFVRVVLKK